MDDKLTAKVLSVPEAFIVSVHTAELKVADAASIVRAERSIDLLMLTTGPLSPPALVNILTVTSCEEVPPNWAVDPCPNKLTPLNFVWLI